MLKIEAARLSPASLADSSKVRVGQLALAMGNPFGVGQTVTLGIIGAVSRGRMGITDYEDFLQTDAAINGEPIADGRALRLRIAQLPPGSSARLDVIRGGSHREIVAKLGQLRER